MPAGGLGRSFFIWSCLALLSIQDSGQREFSFSGCFLDRVPRGSVSFAQLPHLD